MLVQRKRFIEEFLFVFVVDVIVLTIAYELFCSLYCFDETYLVPTSGVGHALAVRRLHAPLWRGRC